MRSESRVTSRLLNIVNLYFKSFFYKEKEKRMKGEQITDKLFRFPRVLFLKKEVFCPCRTPFGDVRVHQGGLRGVSDQPMAEWQASLLGSFFHGFVSRLTSHVSAFSFVLCLRASSPLVRTRQSKGPSDPTQAVVSTSLAPREDATPACLPAFLALPHHPPW